MKSYKYITKLYIWLATKENKQSFWQGIEIQAQLAENIRVWSKTDNYTRIVKEISND